MALLLPGIPVYPQFALFYDAVSPFVYVVGVKMTALSLVWRLAVASLTLLLSANLGVLAQAPTQTWTPAATCTSGLPTPASSNGTYVDAFGANWAVQCAQDSTGFSYDQFEGTNGHGVYACFLGCDNRPGCTAFMYTGTVSGT